MDKLKFFGIWPIDWNASIYYRLLVPIFELQKKGLIDALLDRNDRAISIEQSSMAASHSDIYMCYQRCDPSWKTICDANKGRQSYFRNDGSWGTAPIMVMDTDDDLFNVMPMNPAFKTLGIKVNGQLLEPSPPSEPTQISIELSDGQRVVLFEDHKDDFLIEANRWRLDTFRANLASADLVTCSTPRSRDYVLREVPDANTLIIPNCVDLEAYGHVDHAKSDKIKILWQGSPTHHEDLHPLVPALTKILDENPNVELLIWGAPYKFLSQSIKNKDQIKFAPWCTYDEYKLRMNMVGHDIAIAPLEPSVFNQSRSGIKAYESAACSKPAPTVCQRSGAYQDEIIHGETGFLFDTPDEFEAQVRTLIENESLRTTVASNMKQWLRENRDPATWAMVFFETVNDLVQKRRALVGPPKEPDVDLSEQHDDVQPSESPSS